MRVGVRVRVGMGVSMGGRECMIVCAIEVKDRGWLGYIVKVKGCTCEDKCRQGGLTKVGAWREMVIVRTADVAM